MCIVVYCNNVLTYVKGILQMI